MSEENNMKNNILDDKTPEENYKKKMLILYENMETLNYNFNKYKQKTNKQIKELNDTIERITTSNSSVSSGQIRDTMIKLLTSSEAYYDNE